MHGVTVPLVLVAHGSRDDAAHACVEEIVDAVRGALPGTDVRLGYVDVRGPKVADAVAGLDRAVVVPAFLASGYHVRSDLPAQLAECAAPPDRFPVTPVIGPDPLLARAAGARLVEAGWRSGGAGEQRVGFVATATPRMDAVVADLRAAGERRVAVASWLLAPGVFHARLGELGADVVAAPLGAHHDVVATVVARYRTAA